MSKTVVVGAELWEQSRPQTANGGRPQSANPALDPLSRTGTLQRPQSAVQLRPTSADYGSNNNLLLNNTSERPKSRAGTEVPRFVETDKQVLRFFAHFFERKRPEEGVEFRRTNTVSEAARLLTILIYISDETIEIHEERVINSGLFN
jgi:hypothetical protein